MLNRVFLSFALMLSLGMIVGCGSDKGNGTADGAADATTDGTADGAADGTAHADPHDVPLTDAEIGKLKEDTATWSAAIEHVQKYRDTIKTETTGGTPAKAHRSLDLLDHVLEWLPEVAQNSNVPKDQWQSIGENAQKLRDKFNQVHANIDDGKAPDYESVSAEIDTAVDALAAVQPGGDGGNN